MESAKFRLRSRAILLLTLVCVTCISADPFFLKREHERSRQGLRDASLVVPKNIDYNSGKLLTEYRDTGNMSRVCEIAKETGLAITWNDEDGHTLNCLDFEDPEAHSPDGSYIPLLVLVDVILKAGGSANVVEAVVGDGLGSVEARYDGFVGGVITARASLDTISALGLLPDVQAVTTTQMPFHSSRKLTSQNNLFNEGASILKVDIAAADCGVSHLGQNITIGIISDSFNHMAGSPTDYNHDILIGALPGPGQIVILRDDFGSDEGRAMAQIIHGILPYAKLCFSSGTGSEASFATAIIDLATHPDCMADIIVDDLTFPTEGYFQDTVVASAVAEAVGMGVHYYSAAGNLRGRFREQGLSWGGAVPVDHPIYSVTNGYSFFHDFNNIVVGDGSIPYVPDSDIYTVPFTVESLGNVYLQWSDAWGSVQTDLDLFIFTTDYRISAVSDSYSFANGLPWEGVRLIPGNYRLAIGRWSRDLDEPLPMPYQIVVYAVTGYIGANHVAEYSTSRSILGHNGCNAGMSVAAYPAPSADALAPYSSPGPVTMYYDGDGNPLSPDQRSKPDFAAVDCTLTSFFGQNNTFCGTSAAAPHAAAVGGFLMQLAGGRENFPMELARQVLIAGAELATWDLHRGFGLLNALNSALYLGTINPDIRCVPALFSDSNPNPSDSATPTCSISPTLTVAFAMPDMELSIVGGVLAAGHSLTTSIWLDGSVSYFTFDFTFGASSNSPTSLASDLLLAIKAPCVGCESRYGGYDNLTTSHNWTFQTSGRSGPSTSGNYSSGQSVNPTLSAAGWWDFTITNDWAPSWACSYLNLRVGLFGSISPGTSPSSSHSPSFAKSPSPSPTGTTTLTFTRTVTYIGPSFTPSVTAASATQSPTRSATFTPSATSTPSNTRTPTFTQSPASSPTPTATHNGKPYNMCVSVKEKTTVTVGCSVPDFKMVSVVSGMYGKFVGTPCPVPIPLPACQANVTRVAAVIQSACVNRFNCTMPALNSRFYEDPCKGEQKTVAAIFVCAGSPYTIPPTPTRSPSSPWSPTPSSTWTPPTQSPTRSFSPTPSPTPTV
mmetsp:Transcript_10713/g.17550  ORF Transcript_10713/g.17550 Transcript_10713/m.17550 type:complete len:1061 (+) Transcript_10713:244-3426(+)